MCLLYKYKIRREERVVIHLLTTSYYYCYYYYYYSYHHSGTNKPYIIYRPKYTHVLLLQSAKYTSRTEVPRHVPSFN